MFASYMNYYCYLHLHLHYKLTDSVYLSITVNIHLKVKYLVLSVVNFSLFLKSSTFELRLPSFGTLFHSLNVPEGRMAYIAN